MIQGTARVIVDTATPGLARIREQVRSPRGLMTAAGKQVERVLRAHFLAKDREGNAKGWPRSHFWNRRVRQATAFTGATDTSAEVTIASPEFVHKVTGGVVTPKRGKYLAIPVTARAKAAGSPREGGIADLFVVGRKGGKGRYLATREGGALRVHYRLLTRVVHRPDPTALPADGEISSAIEAEASRYLSREISRAQKGGSR